MVHLNLNFPYLYDFLDKGGAMQLRDYQLETIRSINYQLMNRSKAICVVSPTGSGKTVIIGKIVQSLSQQNLRVYIVAHRIELINQISETLEKYKINHGIISPNHPRDKNHLVQVASVDSLIRRLDFYDEPAFILQDECQHLVKTNKFGKVLHAYPNAKIIGFTATPIRGDGTGLGINYGGFFDSLVIAPSTQWLMKNDYLSPARYFVPPVIADLTGIRKSYGDYNQAELEERLNKSAITGNAIEHYNRICPGQPAIAFCVSIKHAKSVAQAFNEAGITADTIDGTLDHTTRKSLIKNLASGKIKVLTSCEVISEGTDIPVVSAAILLRPTHSLGLHLQQIGRVLRKAPNKTHAYILDHVGNTLKHGFAESTRKWSLEGISKKRKTEQTIPMRQCPNCYCCHSPTPMCPLCGHVYKINFQTINEEQGELREITKKEKMKLQEKKNEERRNASSYEELKKIELKRGYKNGWAQFVWQGKLKQKGHGYSY